MNDTTRFRKTAQMALAARNTFAAQKFMHSEKQRRYLRGVIRATIAEVDAECRELTAEERRRIESYELLLDNAWQQRRSARRLLKKQGLTVTSFPRSASTVRELERRAVDGIL